MTHPMTREELCAARDLAMSIEPGKVGILDQAIQEWDREHANHAPKERAVRKPKEKR